MLKNQTCSNRANSSCVLKKPSCCCKFVADGTQPVPYAVQRGIMQGIVDQEVALSTHRDESQECVDANKLCVWRENEIWWCILILFSPPVL